MAPFSPRCSEQPTQHANSPPANTGMKVAKSAGWMEPQRASLCMKASPSLTPMLGSPPQYFMMWRNAECVIEAKPSTPPVLTTARSPEAVQMPVIESPHLAPGDEAMALITCQGSLGLEISRSRIRPTRSRSRSRASSACSRGVRGASPWSRMMSGSGPMNTVWFFRKASTDSKASRSSGFRSFFMSWLLAGSMRARHPGRALLAKDEMPLRLDQGRRDPGHHNRRPGNALARHEGLEGEHRCFRPPGRRAEVAAAVCRGLRRPSAGDAPGAQRAEVDALAVGKTHHAHGRDHHASLRLRAAWAETALIVLRKTADDAQHIAGARETRKAGHHRGLGELIAIAHVQLQPVLHALGGQPLAQHVLATARFQGFDQRVQLVEVA